MPDAEGDPEGMKEVMGNNEDDMAEEMSDMDDGPSFHEFDINQDGGIDINEMMTYATKNGIDLGDAEAMHGYMDQDGDGYVSQSEFEGKGAQDATEDMAPDMGYLDISGDGKLDMEEWSYGCECGKSYLDTCGSEEQCEDIFNTADDDKDGYLTEQEFNDAGDECKTADDGNCDFLVLGNGDHYRDHRRGRHHGHPHHGFIADGKIMSLGEFVRKHFKLTGRNLFYLAMLRAQHKNGKSSKVLKFAFAKRHPAHQRPHEHSGKARKEQLMRQKPRHGKAKKARPLMQKDHRLGFRSRLLHLMHHK